MFRFLGYNNVRRNKRPNIMLKAYYIGRVHIILLTIFFFFT